jgi:hypothetical protein
MTATPLTTDAMTIGTVAPLPARVGPVPALQQTCSLAWRTLVQIKHNPFELVDFSIQPVMFLLLFVYVFGGAIGGSPHAYLQYLLAGIMVQNSLFTTLNTATGLATDLDKGFFSRLPALPITRSAPLAGRRRGPRQAGEQSQQRPQPRPADLNQAPGPVTNLNRPEHADPHTTILPALRRSRVCPHSGVPGLSARPQSPAATVAAPGRQTDNPRHSGNIGRLRSPRHPEKRHDRE